MKKIAKRSLVLWVLFAGIVLGMLYFCVQYVRSANEWAIFPGSPHLYTGGNLDTGTVTDASGTLLLSQQDGAKTYAEDALLRQATLHLLGDREGYIPSTILSEYADEMIGFSRWNGLYGAETGQMTLTVYAAAQKAALAALDGRAGCVGVYNYKTGEILCAVSGPTYDPDNVPDIAGDTTGQYDGVYVNRLFHATYTPGSIFKLITAGAALETFDDPLAKTYTCTGTTIIGEQVITCEGVHGTIDLRTGLAKSCNVAFGEAAAELGGDVLERYAQKAGVTGSLSFDGLQTMRGQFDLKEAVPADIAWAGIGQYTDLINPCAYMTFVGAIAGGGRGAQPYLVKSIENGGRTVYKAETKLGSAVLDAQTAQTLASWMRNNVQTVYGDGNFGGLSVCAKSGTAEVGGGVRPNATFTGFVQDEQYPLAFIVVVQDAGSGSSVCIPIVSAVLQACVQAMTS